MGRVPTMFAAALLAISGVAIATVAPHTTQASYSHELNDLKNRFAAIERSTKAYETTTNNVIKALSRQMMLQQLFVEERIRSDGDSGIKQTRVTSSGTRPYYPNTFTSGGVCSMHEHANYDRTIGLGEFIAVLNGVEFRTRHNDYKLMMPSKTKKNYNLLEEIPFPDVPPSVLKKHTVTEQIAEMKQYFRAFHEQNYRIRDFRPYFKPVMCYLEGGWTTNTHTLEEPFASDRHGLEATSWFDLQEKIRYTSFSGSKNNNENFSYLPTTIINVTEHGQPVFAQWNYRIACHPIKAHLDLKYFSLIDDLAPRMRRHQDMDTFAKSRAARFTLNPRAGYSYKKDVGHAYLTPRGSNWGKLDEIMMEIPGKENYPGALTDDAFELMDYRIDMKNLTVLNTARYHRFYKVNRRGAMGLSVRRRGYADDNMWTAETLSPHIANMGVNDCFYDSKIHKKRCVYSSGRFTYAVPLEIVWMTPLSSWNPYNLTIHDRRHASVVTTHGRNGDLKNTSLAYDGVSFKNFYLTPAEFFEGGEVNRDAADTAKNAVGVLDQHGQIKRMSATGHRIFLPEIHGVGKIRQRYPIMPLHQDGSAVWKNLQALQDVTMDMKRYTNMFEQRPAIQDLDAHAPDRHFITSTSYANPPGMHHHDLYITAEQVTALGHNGTRITVFTTENSGHQHELELEVYPSNANVLKVVSCDGVATCWDHHGHFVYHST